MVTEEVRECDSQLFGQSTQRAYAGVGLAPFELAEEAGRHLGAACEIPQAELSHAPEFTYAAAHLGLGAECVGVERVVNHGHGRTSNRIQQNFVFDIS